MNPADSPQAQWHGTSDNPMMQRVQQWLADGRRLAWLPIFSPKNFPGIDPEILFYAEQSPQRHCWFIDQVDDFQIIPEGITGWLLPDGEVDTDVVVGLWEDTVHFCSVTDRRTGQPQTLQTGRAWEVEPGVAESADGARFDLASAQHSAFMDLSQLQEPPK